MVNHTWKSYGRLKKALKLDGAAVLKVISHILSKQKKLGNFRCQIVSSGDDPSLRVLWWNSENVSFFGTNRYRLRWATLYTLYLDTHRMTFVGIRLLLGDLSFVGVKRSVTIRTTSKNQPSFFSNRIISLFSTTGQRLLSNRVVYPSATRTRTVQLVLPVLGFPSRISASSFFFPFITIRWVFFFSVPSPFRLRLDF